MTESKDLSLPFYAGLLNPLGLVVVGVAVVSVVNCGMTAYTIHQNNELQVSSHL